MAQRAVASVGPPSPRKRKFRPPRALLKFLQYTLKRGIALMITVTVGVYIVVWIANMGGYVDRIRRAEIQEQVALEVRANENLRNRPASEIDAYMQERIRLEEIRIGLDKPFIYRSFGYLKNAITLSLGRAERMSSDSGSREVKRIILERLPASMMLFTTASMIVFFAAVFFALFLSRRYGSALDRAVVVLAPTSSAPAWFYGIFLILIFAAVLGVLPYGGMLDAPPPVTTLGRVLSVLKHMILPITAWSIGGIFIATYGWRTFFLIHSSEDYVELAKAKGLRSNTIERRYVLRPTLPTIVTNFAFILITAWQGAIITEAVFSWPGLGTMYFTAIGQFDTPVIIGATVIFAYLLVITVFLLDIVYALVDPRVKLGAEGSE